MRADGARGDYVQRGSLECEGCGLGVPIRQGIPRFTGAAYATNFSKQWKQFVEIDRFYDMDTEQYYATGLGLRPSDVTGKRVLEVGCGSGRGVAHFLKGSPELLVAMDLSEAVDVVEHRFRDRRELLVVQADIASMPLAEASFDVVYSYGVLHHTPSPPEYFATVAERVAPGGRLAVYLYRTGTIVGAISRLVQRNSHHLPRWFLVSFCWLMTALGYGLYAESRLPLPGAIHGFLLHLVRYFFRITPSRHLSLNYLWAHDFHTTRYMFEYEPAEVFAWYERAGFRDMRPLRGSGMIGTRIGEAPGAKRATRKRHARAEVAS